jgi:hypothetical protein
MSGWENFFLGQLSASAALTGLVFLGTSINLKKIMESPFLPNHALEALIAFVSTLYIAFLMLIPGQSFLAQGIEVLCGGLLTWTIMTYLHVNTLRKIPAPAPYRRAVVGILVLYHLAALSFVAAGLSFLVWGAPGFYGIVVATFLSYLAAFFDTWLLVVEINR